VKLSISVPEQLWEEARAYRPDLSPSHLVQTSLEALAHAERTSTLAERPAQVDEAFAAARDRFIQQAHERYHCGYAAAVDLASQVDWWVVESLARDNFDVPKWANGFVTETLNAAIGLIPKDWGPGPAVLGAMIKALGNLADPSGEGWAPDAAYLRGFTQAMRALWTEVFERTPSGLLDHVTEDQQTAEEAPIDEKR
jgi:post-segregation antitoxin (ccd killing protein)